MPCVNLSYLGISVPSLSSSYCSIRGTSRLFIYSVFPPIELLMDAPADKLVATSSVMDFGFLALTFATSPFTLAFSTFSFVGIGMDGIKDGPEKLTSG